MYSQEKLVRYSNFQAQHPLTGMEDNFLYIEERSYLVTNDSSGKALRGICSEKCKTRISNEDHSDSHLTTRQVGLKQFILRAFLSEIMPQLKWPHFIIMNFIAAACKV